MNRLAGFHLHFGKETAIENQGACGSHAALPGVGVAGEKLAGEEAGGRLLWLHMHSHVPIGGEVMVFVSAELITDHKVTRGPLCSSTQG